MMENAWLNKPLCCRYLFAEFKTLRLPVRDGGAVNDIQWRWALGLFKQCQYEILGAWPTQVAPAHAMQDLHQRGIEHIRAVAADDATDVIAHYTDAATWPVVGDDATALSQSAVGTFDPRRRATLRAAAATAERLQRSLKRAIRRCAPFADEAAAAAFLAQQLEKADRGFWAV
jgi:hypothetical protein